MKTVIVLEVKKLGKNELVEMREFLNEFVMKNFDILYEGACRLYKDIPYDSYAPARVQINGTRLHREIGLKYANSHKYDDSHAPTKEQLLNTAKDLQLLLDAAAEIVPCSFTISIVKK
jgi:hypothetical protein